MSTTYTSLGRHGHVIVNSAYKGTGYIDREIKTKKKKGFLVDVDPNLLPSAQLVQADHEKEQTPSLLLFGGMFHNAIV